MFKPILFTSFYNNQLINTYRGYMDHMKTTTAL